MRSATPTCLALALCLPSLAAQTTKTAVVPAALANKEGNAFDDRPFGYNRARVAQFIGASQLAGALPKGATISAVAYRRDGTVLEGATLTRVLTNVADPIWTIRMGNFVGNARNPLPYHATPTGSRGNGPGVTTVFNAKVVKFPDLAHTKGVLPSFVIKFPLDYPHLYDGTNLCIDHYVYESRGAGFAYYIDSERGSIDTGSSKEYGTACPVDANRAYALTTNPGNGTLDLWEFDAVPNTPAICMVGASATNLGPYPLPIKLDPLGLKGCELLCSMDIILPVTTNLSGSARFEVAMPADAPLGGITAFVQWVNVDTRISQALPLTFSNGVALKTGTSIGTIGAIDGALVWGVNQAGPVNGQYGFVDPGYALVTEFTYQ
ncbi:MAG: hypothetical protein R3F30_01080 [Planctomycetota bacterium]